MSRSFGDLLYEIEHAAEAVVAERRPGKRKEGLVQSGERFRGSSFP